MRRCATSQSEFASVGGRVLSGVAVVSFLCLISLTQSRVGHAGEARADIAPDGSPRSDLDLGLLAIASSIGPFHIRGSGEAYGEADTASGSLTAIARAVNLQTGIAFSEITDTFTVVPLPGVVPTGPVTAMLVLDFAGDIDLDAPSGDGLTSHGLVTIITVTLDHVSAPGSRTRFDRARVRKTLGELTRPITPSVDGPRNVFASETLIETENAGSVNVRVDGRTRFAGELSIPLTAPVGRSFAFEASLSASVSSGMGYITFNGFEDGAILSLVLPPGYTFSSGSGVLLTQPLPEPHVSLQLLAGSTAIGIACRRRRRGRRHESVGGRSRPSPRTGQGDQSAPQ